MRILVVCVANMCRSPAAAHLLAQELREVPGVHVSSAGVAAVAGSPACAVSADTAGYDGARHRARVVVPEEVAGADLVLAADREVRAALVRMSPAARARTFTLLQAAALADSVSGALADGRLPEGAPPLPEPSDPAGRVRWLVEELDAARGLTGVVVEDIDDPHLGGPDGHAPLAVIPPASASVARLVRAVLAPQ